MMMRPRDSHDLRLLETSLILRPAASVRWIHDVFGNSVAIATFARPASELYVASVFRTEHFPLSEHAVQVEAYARHYPFSYDASELPDVTPSMQRHYLDPEQRVASWARQFIGAARDQTPLAILSAMTRAIQGQFNYNPRDEMGTQNPLTTLAARAGTCRDYALLLMEAARSLGFAARFVSGYLYDESKIRGGPETVIGGGVTHAWAKDEELVRLVAVEALEDAGFEVIEAEHAEAALGVLQTDAARIHVLFTDIHMPGTIDGLALAHHIANNWPKIALLLTSARPPYRRSLPEKSRFLAKPYRHAHVIRHIRELAAAA
jgi:CheY-like chemotaxis protein